MLHGYLGNHISRGRKQPFHVPHQKNMEDHDSQTNVIPPLMSSVLFLFSDSIFDGSGQAKMKTEPSKDNLVELKVVLPSLLSVFYLDARPAS